MSSFMFKTHIWTEVQFNTWNIHLHIKPAAIELQLNVYFMYIVYIVTVTNAH